MSAAVPPRQGRAATTAARVAAWVGLLLHLAAGAVPYAGTGLLAPPWAVVFLWGSWALLLGAWVLLRRTRPWLAAGVPLLALAWWVAVISLGEFAGGWTA